MLLIITPEQQMENGTVLDKLGGMINLYKGGRVGRGMGTFFIVLYKKYRSVVNCNQKQLVLYHG